MFFLLYALGLVVLLAGWVAGLALTSIAGIYAIAACAVAAGLSYLKSVARRSEPAPPVERRKPENLQRMTFQ
jgi:hypothetical protein